MYCKTIIDNLYLNGWNGTDTSLLRIIVKDYLFALIFICHEHSISKSFIDFCTFDIKKLLNCKVSFAIKAFDDMCPILHLIYQFQIQ